MSSSSKSSADTGAILLWWERLSRLPFGRRLFSIMLGRMAPYSGTIGARIEEVRPGYARVFLRDRKKVRNHLDSIHAIALVNLGELATGLATISTFSTNMRGILQGISAEYLKKARGTLVATAHFELPDDIQDNTSCDVEAELTDQAGEVVTRIRATWVIGYKT